MKKIFSVAFVILTFSFLSGCKEDGTDTGNPGDNAQYGSCDIARCVATPFVQIQVAVICKSLHRCSGVDESQCQTQLMSLDGLDREILSTARTYTELESRYHKQHLGVDGGAFNTCLKSLQEVSCDNPDLTNIYDVADPLNFSRIHEILRLDSACHDIYTDI